MSKRKNWLVLVFSLFVSLIILNLIMVAALSSSTETDMDRRVIESYKNSPLMKGVGYYVFGLKDLESQPEIGNYGAATILIVFVLIWLILFVTFSDIIVSFAPFSNAAIGWIVGAAITIIAANLKVVQYVSIWLVKYTAIFGTFSVFFGIFMAFVAFIAISWGGGSLAEWAVERKMHIRAHRGRTNVGEGIQLFNQAGQQAQRQMSQTWWIPLAIAIAIGIITLLLVVYS